MKQILKMNYMFFVTILCCVKFSLAQETDIRDSIKIFVEINKKKVSSKSLLVRISELDTLKFDESKQCYLFLYTPILDAELCTKSFFITYNSKVFEIRCYPFYFSGREGKTDLVIRIQNPLFRKRIFLFKYLLSAYPYNELGYGIGYRCKE